MGLCACGSLIISDLRAPLQTEPAVGTVIALTDVHAVGLSVPSCNNYAEAPHVHLITVPCHDM